MKYIDCRLYIVILFQDMNLLLSRLDSPSSGDHEAAALMKKVETMRQRQREVTQEEMQIVMEQRDIALAKVNLVILNPTGHNYFSN